MSAEPTDELNVNIFECRHAMEHAQSLASAGDIVAARAAYRAILAAAPQFHPAYQALGLIAFDNGNLPLAADLFRTAISLDRNVAIYYRNYGEICRRLGRCGEAVEAGLQACRLAPADIDAHFNLALAYSDARDTANATQAYLHVLALQDPYLAAGTAPASMWNMRGVALHRMERFEEAGRCYQRALDLHPDFPPTLNGLGSLLREVGKTEESVAYFTKALEINPQFSDARLNLAMAQLYLGNWQAGWENYEARWLGSAESQSGTFLRPPCPLPQWTGSGESPQQTLLIFSEQGFGDLFQFVRYVELALPRFAKIGLVCPIPATHVLMEWSFGERVVLLKQMPQDFTPWHWQCPLMSLPYAFGTTPQTVPAKLPYLKVSKTARSHWRNKLDIKAPGRFTVGVAWQGRRSHQYDKRRSLQFEQLLPLLKDTRISWVSLQKLDADQPRPVLPENVDWIDWTEELIDFADTAALVANLDLVITIDSAMVHLAGALARPVWMLNRFDSEWRWLAQRESSPWYPQLRIFNQPRFGDWASVERTVKLALTALRIPPTDNNSVISQRMPEALPLIIEAAPVSNNGIPDEQQLHRLATLFAEGRHADATSLAEDLTARYPMHSMGWKALGALYGKAGRHDAALAAAHKAAGLAPDDAEAYHNLGIAQRESGLLEEAEKSYRQALQINPYYAEAHQNMGIILRQLGRYTESETAYRQALQFKPDFLDASYNLGNLYLQIGQMNEAEASYRRALEIRPHSPEVYNNLGIVLRSMGKLEEAENHYRQALQRKPDYAEAYYNLGITLIELDRAAEAEAANRRALELQPDYAEAHNNLGINLERMERFAEAEASYRAALACKADYAEAHYNLANILMKMERVEAAQASYQDALRINPAYVQAHNNLGILLKEMGNLDAAQACYQQAIQIDADSVEAHNNLGIVLSELGRLEESEASLQRALALKPDYDEAHYNLGLTYMLSGRLEEAWPKYEHRWNGGSPKQTPPASPLPQWTGQIPAVNDRLLIFGEQGMGDKLQFARYLPLVMERFQGRVSVIADQPLLALFQHSFPGIEFLDTVPEDQSAWQYFCPMLSLPLAFHTSLASIPSAMPYLVIDPDRQVGWRARIDALALPAGVRKIGIVWKTGTIMKNAPRRSLALQQLTPLFNSSDCRWFSLQKEPDPHSAQWVAENKLIDWSDAFTDFADTAALIGNLDLVISVDTSVAHLAGSLGKPTWLFNRQVSEWRWMRDREDSPWYPSMRIFTQQKEGEWGDVVQRMAAALADGKLA